MILNTLFLIKNMAVFNAKLSQKTYSKLCSTLKFKEKDIENLKINQDDNHVQLDKLQLHEIILQRSDPIAFFSENDETKRRLLSNLFVYLAGYSLSEQKSQQFSHPKRTTSRHIHGYIWKKKLPGRLKTIIPSNFKTFKFSDCTNSLKDIFQSNIKELSDDKNITGKFLLEQDITCSLKIDQNRFDDFFKNEYKGNSECGEDNFLNNITVTQEGNSSYLSGKFNDWIDFTKKILDDTNLEEKLYNIQQQEEADKIIELIKNKSKNNNNIKHVINIEENIDDKKHNQNSDTSSMHGGVKTKIESLTKFKEFILSNTQLMNYLMKKKNQLQSQQFFRKLAADIDIEIKVLKAIPEIDNQLFEEQFKKNHEIIKDLLLIHDSNHIGEAHKSFLKIKVNLTKSEIEQIFLSLKNSFENKLSNEDVVDNLNKLNVTQYLHIKDHTKIERELLSLKESVENNDLQSKSKIDNFLSDLCSITKVADIKYSKLISVRRCISSILHYIPILSALNIFLHPRNVVVELLNEKKEFGGTKVSKKIRKALNIQYDLKSIKKFLSHSESHLLVDKVREKYNLMTRKEKFLFMFKKKKHTAKNIIVCIILLMITFHIFVLILKRCNVKIGYISNIFNINIIILKLMLALFVINVIIENIIKHIFCVVVMAFKYVDQFLLGRIFARVLNLLKSIFCGVVFGFINFLEKAFITFSEYGFKKTMMIALDSTCNFFTIKQLEKTLIDLLTYCKDKFQEPALQENPYIFSTYSFNILNIVGSLKKLYNFFSYYKSDEYNKEISALINYIDTFMSSNADKEILNANDYCKLAFHEKIVLHMLNESDHAKVSEQYNTLYKNNDQFRRALNSTNDELILKLLGVEEKGEISIGRYINEFYMKKFIYMKNKLNLEGRKSCDSEKCDFEVTNRLNALKSIKDKLSVANKSTSRHYRIFPYNCALVAAQNALNTYQSILLSNTNSFSLDELRLLDNIFSPFLNDVATVIAAVDSLTVKHTYMKSTNDFCNAFNGVTIFKSKKKNIKEIIKYIERDHDVKCIFHDLPDIIYHGVSDIISPLTLLSIALFHIPNFNVIMTKIDPKKLTKIGELGHFAEHIHYHVLNDNSVETILEIIETLKCSAEVIEDWTKLQEIITKSDVCMKAIERMKDITSKHLTKKKQTLNDIAYHVLRPFSIIEDIVNYYMELKKKDIPSSNVESPKLELRIENDQYYIAIQF